MSNPVGLQRKFGFTLLEVLIVIALIVILAFVFLTLSNPKFQIEKGWDSERKKELNTLKKVFEEYYNDNNCYPKPDEVCYDVPQQLSSGNYVCKVCGNEAAPTNFSAIKSYSSRLPCDPQHPSKDYLYEVDDQTCPSFYRIYTRLSNKQDNIISEVGCTSGCAPEGYTVNSESVFNYGVTSPNVSLQMVDTEMIHWVCKTGYTCEACCYSGEIDCSEGVPTCPNLPIPGYCRIYATYNSCISDCQRAIDANDCW